MYKTYKKYYIYKYCLILILHLFIIRYNRSNSKQNISDINADIIKIGYYCRSIKYGGIERVMALLINHLSKEKIFVHYLISKSGILEDEYPIPNSTRRINLNYPRRSVFDAIEENHIDILIYNFYNRFEIQKLNKLNKTKIIYYNHSTFFYWIYLHVYNFKNSIYRIYKQCDYVISLIPVENDYLFKKWGIKSILMDNPSTIEYDSVIPSDLTQKNIIMIGRSDDPIKRYNLGIEAMEKIIKVIPECKMNIVSVPNDKYVRLIKKLNLSDYVRFVGFHKNVELYFKNSSLHILPSLGESYAMVLSEAKIFGVPSIICGLDYLALAKGGTVIIYDDNPETIAKEAIKILSDYKYRIKLGQDSRLSMKRHTNQLITNRWVKLLISVFKGDNTLIQALSDNEEKITDIERDKILKNQFRLFLQRKPNFKKITFENFIDYSF